MNIEEQRIELMKFMGWKWVRFPEPKSTIEALVEGRPDHLVQLLYQPDCSMGWIKKFKGRLSEPPHDLSDADWSSAPPLTLDLLRDAVEKMNEDQRHAYAVLLAMQFWPMGWSGWQSTLAVSEATIAERLHPILKALDLWRED